MSMTLNARYEFAPPPPPGMLRAFALALAAHALLLAFLAMGVQWKHLPTPVTVEAELWSSVPEQAAPPAPKPLPVEPPPPPEPPAPVVTPKPPPVVPTPDPAIAVAREKARLLKEKQALEAQKLAQLEQEKREKEALKAKKLQTEKDAREKEAREKEQRDKLAQKKPKDDAAARQAAKDAAREAAEARKLDELRQENMKRLAGLAAGTGEPGARGTAARSSGPSAGYAGKISARIRANITYIESITSNPSAEVEVRAASGGTILSRRLVKSSGIPSWDDAVLNAIDKTETLPADTDGRVPSQLILVFRPRD